LADDGFVGYVNLRVILAISAEKYPNTIHEGNCNIVSFVDEKARQKQVGAFCAVLAGQLGGMPWEAIATTVARLECAV